MGTPYSSGWMQEVTHGGREDTDADELAVVNDIEQLQALPPHQRERLRYVLLSHDNDGVTKFGTDLIMRRPGGCARGRPASRRPSRTARAASPPRCAGAR